MTPRAPDSLLARLHPRRGDGDVPTVDLRGVDWVTPALMVGVAALAHAARGADRPFAVRAPARHDPAHYAARMRLGRVLAGLGAAHDLPGSAELDQRHNLVELTAIDGPGALERLSRLVHRKVRPRDAELAHALHQCVGEIGQNVADHSRTIGFLAAQTLPRRDELLLAIGDAGVGMLSTLRRRGARDHEHAVALAVRDHVSRHDEPERGAGLPSALRLITAEAGSLYVASGTASIRHFPSTRRYLACGDGCASGFPGTILEARIPLGVRT